MHNIWYVTPPKGVSIHRLRTTGMEPIEEKDLGQLLAWVSQESGRRWSQAGTWELREDGESPCAKDKRQRWTEMCGFGGERNQGGKGPDVATSIEVGEVQSLWLCRTRWEGDGIHKRGHWQSPEEKWHRAEWALRGDGHLVVRRDQESRGRGYSQVFSISVKNRKSGLTENLI